MPRPSLPPTPAASTEIPGKADPGVAQDPSWVLPPAAMSDRSRSSVSSSSTSSSTASDSSYYPVSPVPVKQSVATGTQNSTSNSKKRPAKCAVDTQDEYALPPPPTRSRKIIQMKPKSEKPLPQNQEARATETAPAAGTAAKGKGGAGGRGKKQNNGTTTAGRKVARKTAHSLIERRRRSKMNEEFGVLKDMIPACAGQEMHKLAILQASIEYMSYLERCVAELKAANRAKRTSESPPQQEPTTTTQWDAPTTGEDYEESEADQDEDMSDAASPNATTPNAQATVPAVPEPPSSTTSPTIFPTDRGCFSAQASPAIFPADGGHRRLSSITPSPNLFGMSSQPFSFSVHSSTTSPSILPSPSVVGQPESRSRHQSFALTSPALGPQPDSREDHEATAALLMLNSDRRTWSGANSTASTPRSRGMSVKDLLSG